MIEAKISYLVGMASLQRRRKNALAVLGLTRNPSNLAIRDFSQRHHDLTVIGFDQRFRALEELPGPQGCQHNQLKPVIDSLKTIFDRDA
jgi:hypothetical protein